MAYARTNPVLAPVHPALSSEALTYIRFETSALADMLRYCRPAGSKTEEAFIARFIAPLKGVERDGAGNLVGRIGSAPIMWSSHTDTVHRKEGEQQVMLDLAGRYRLADAEKASSCLGADCATGVWLMREMYLAGVEGLYVWHRGEECGGIGSTWIAQRNPRLLDGIQFAIALDRRGASSVVTHQGYQRCASAAFAKSMTAQLGGSYAPDDGGTFTDTANYTGLVPECTNLGVGYAMAHSSDESQDAAHAVALLDKLKRLNVDDLACERDPNVVEFDDWRSGCATYVGSTYERFDYGGRYGSTIATSGRRDTIEDLLRQYPREVADILERQGFTAEDIEDEIDQMWSPGNR